MGILIKGMEMPENCRDCPMEMFYINCGDTRCKLTNKLLAKDYNVIPFSSRPYWCPLIEVPAPHGRLIDADKLKDDYPMENLYMVDDAQTVIEAEEGDDYDD